MSGITRVRAMKQEKKSKKELIIIPIQTTEEFFNDWKQYLMTKRYRTDARGAPIYQSLQQFTTVDITCSCGKNHRRIETLDDGKTAIWVMASHCTECLRIQYPTMLIAK